MSDKIRTGRKLIRHEPLVETPVPIAQDARDNPGAIVLGDDGQLWASTKEVTDNGYSWRPLVVDNAFGTINTFVVYVDWTAPFRTAEEIALDPPTSIANAVPSLLELSTWLSTLTLSPEITAEIRVAPGLYMLGPTRWAANVRFVAYEADFSQPLATADVDAIDASFDTPINSNNDHGWFHLEQAQNGYGDLVTAPHFLCYNRFVPGNNVGGLILAGATAEFTKSVAFWAGFHFVGLDLQIALVRDALDNPNNYPTHLTAAGGGLHPEYLAHRETGDLTVGDWEDFYTTDRDTNLDTYVAAYMAEGFSDVSQSRLFGYLSEPIIRLSGGTGTLSRLRDMVFGPAFLNQSWVGGVARSGFIDIVGDGDVSLINLYIFGANTMTTTGTTLTATSSSWENPTFGVGADSGAAPYTITGTTAVFVRSVNPSAKIDLTWDNRQFQDTSEGRIDRFVYYQMPEPSGMLLPNHIFLCGKDGSINTGALRAGDPYFTAGFFHFAQGSDTLFPYRFPANHSPFGIRSTDAEAARYAADVYTPGLVGKFGLNGMSTQPTRLTILGASTMQAGWNVREGGVTFSARVTDSSAIFAVPYDPALGTNPIEADNSNVGPGNEGKPFPDVTIGTTPVPDEVAGIGAAVVTWQKGVDITQGTIIRTNGAEDYFAL